MAASAIEDGANVGKEGAGLYKVSVSVSKGFHFYLNSNKIASRYNQRMWLTLQELCAEFFCNMVYCNKLLMAWPEIQQMAHEGRRSQAWTQIEVQRVDDAFLFVDETSDIHTFHPNL
jgi:hypothetical protein